MSFLSSLDIAASALSAQRTRMDIISQNISNAQTTRTEDGTPYRRQLVVFQEKKTFKQYLGENRAHVRNAGVRVAKVVKDETPLIPVYDPTHPDADENGYYYMPNVNIAKENIDLMAATNAYSSNITAMNAVKAMANKAMEIIK